MIFLCIEFPAFQKQWNLQPLGSFLPPGSCYGACGLTGGREVILARVVNNTEPASYLEALLPLGCCPPHHCLLDFRVEDLDFGPSCAPA